MSAVVLSRGEDGKLVGFGEKGKRAWNKFQKAVRDMEIGETLSFSYKHPRSGKFHRLFFKTLSELFDRQEQFQHLDVLRAWLTVGAGYCTFAPSSTGKMVAIPQSIAYDEMDDLEFYDYFMAVDTFMESSYATSFLWPHLGPEQRQENINQLLTEFRQDRAEMKAAAEKQS
jgi:Protein of unknown function (DUF1367)